jgi:hypothetical protein
LRMARMVRDIEGPIRVSTVRGWMVGMMHSLRGRLPQPNEIDLLAMATELALAGRKPVRSVVVDDAHLYSDDELSAIRLVTEDTYFTAVSDPHNSGADRRLLAALGPDEAVTLTESQRHSRSGQIARDRWAGLRTKDGSAESDAWPRVLITEPEAHVAMMARQWRLDRTLRLAVVPMDPDQRTTLANKLVGAGVGRARVFSTDIPLSTAQRTNFGGGGFYLLRPQEVGGLEFDRLAITSAELMTGDITAAQTRRMLVDTANSVAGDLTICWNGRGRVPTLIQALKS